MQRIINICDECGKELLGRKMPSIQLNGQKLIVCGSACALRLWAEQYHQAFAEGARIELRVRRKENVMAMKKKMEAK